MRPNLASLASIENERPLAADRLSALEIGQRRVLAALENERLAAAERQRQMENGQRALLSRLSETQDSVQHLIRRSALKSVKSITAEQRRLGRDMAKIQRDQTAETEALLQLFREFEPRAPMPSSGRWDDGSDRSAGGAIPDCPEAAQGCGRTRAERRSGLPTPSRRTAGVSSPSSTRGTLPIAQGHSSSSTRTSPPPR